MRRTFSATCLLIAAASLGLAVLPSASAQALSPLAAQPIPFDSELADLSLEQLSSVVVTSVSRQEERLSNVAASIFIISAADIRRSGVRSIPEALRLAPNLQVARVDARNYAITARGFNSAFANKLLVMIDGRSIYSPLFSGVFWDAQDLVMEDIERIEVISGAGATIWGTNAVNGVINVITRSARETPGGLASATAGEHERSGVARYGVGLPGDGHMRLYAKSSGFDDTATADGQNTGTGMRRSQAGFRADWDQPRGALTISGDAYRGALGQLGTPDIRIGGANLQGRLTRKLDNDADLRLQVILDHTERDQPGAFAEHLETLDIEAQHGVRVGQRHYLVWGGGYRHSWDRVVNGPSYGFLPGDLALHSGNLFAQDEITLLPALKLTAGLKVEHNNYTGAEVLPNLRLAWSIDPTQLLWSSLSRSVRAPSRIDRDLYAPTQPLAIPGLPRYVLGGGPDFQSEVARVAELGYRAQPHPQWSYSVTAYYSEYDRLRTLEIQADRSQVFTNHGQGRSRGVEMWTQWQPLPIWRLNAGLALQHVDTRVDWSVQGGDAGLASNDPARHWLLRSSLDLSERMQLDLTLRHTSSLPSPSVPGYSELDLQWLWKLRHDIDLALQGQNLLHREHAEFGGAGRSVFERSLLLKLSKRF